jgi:hypothetical protein
LGTLLEEWWCSLEGKRKRFYTDNLPRKQLRLVQAWIELHRDELMADWELAVNGEEPYKITPL